MLLIVHYSNNCLYKIGCKQIVVVYFKPSVLRKKVVAMIDVTLINRAKLFTVVCCEGCP